MKLIIDIDEDIRVAIGQMGLLRIPDEMIRVVDKAIQHSTPLDKIRDEITAIAISGQVDEHTAFIRTGEQVKQMALDIIDKYKGDKK